MVCASKKSVYQTESKRQQHGQILLVGSGAEVLVHLVESVEHCAEVLGADREHGRKTDGRIHRIAAADPVPEAEHVGGIDAELRYFAGIRRHSDEVLRDRTIHRRRASRAARSARCAHWSWSRAW